MCIVMCLCCISLHILFCGWVDGQMYAWSDDYVTVCLYMYRWPSYYVLLLFMSIFWLHINLYFAREKFTQNETSPFLVKCCTIKACLELLIFEQGGIFIVTCDTGRRFTRSHPKSSRLLRQARVLRTYPKQNPLRIIFCLSISWLHCYIFYMNKDNEP